MGTPQPTTTTGTTSTTTEAEVDSFLQAVNGELPGFESSKDEDGPFQFGNDNQTNESDATIVNAELPDLSVDVDSSSEAVDDGEGISTTESDSEAFSTEVVDESNDGIIVEPVTVIDVIDIEGDAWEDVPDNSIDVVDNWPVETEEELVTNAIPDITTSAPMAGINAADSVGSEEDDSQTVEDSDDIEEPVTVAANLAEIEDDAWLEVSEDTQSLIPNNWPSLSVDAVIAEEELSTVQPSAEISEITTNNPGPPTAPIIVEIPDEAAWEDVSDENSYTVDKWPKPPVVAVIAEEEVSTVQSDNNSNDNPDFAAPVDDIDVTEQPEMSTVRPRDSIDETTTQAEQIIHRDGQETTTDFAEVDQRLQQETTTEIEVINSRVGQETTTSYEEVNQRVGQETTTEVVEIYGSETTLVSESSTDGKETIKVKIVENIDNILSIYQNITDYEDGSGQEIGNDTTEMPSSIPVVKTAEATEQEQTNSDSVSQTMASEFVDSTDNPNIFTEQPIVPENKITFADEMFGTVEPVSLVDLPDLSEESSTKNTAASNDKIIFIEEEVTDTTTAYTFAGEINDDDAENDYDVETSTIHKEVINEIYLTAFNNYQMNIQKKLDETLISKKKDKSENEENNTTTDISTSFGDHDEEVSEDRFKQATVANYVDDEDKIQVVTSMTLKESEQRLQDNNRDNDNVSVVTSLPVQEPVKSWDELELFEEIDQADNDDKPIKVAEKLFDEYTTEADMVTTSEKNMEELLVESTTVNKRKVNSDVSTIPSFLKDYDNTQTSEGTTLNAITDYSDGENFKTMEEIDEPTSDTINISTQDDNISQKKGQDDDETSILFGLDIPNRDYFPQKAAEETTYFPSSGSRKSICFHNNRITRICN